MKSVYLWLTLLLILNVTHGWDSFIEDFIKPYRPNHALFFQCHALGTLCEAFSKVHYHPAKFTIFECALCECFGEKIRCFQTLCRDSVFYRADRSKHRYCQAAVALLKQLTTEPKFVKTKYRFMNLDPSEL